MAVLSSPSSYAVLDGFRASAGRLVVLVTEEDHEQADSSCRIWSWATEAGLHVLLIGLLAHEDEEPRLRRHLVSLAAAIGDARITVEIRVEPWDDWIESIKALWRRGDILVCHQSGDTGNHRDSLDQLLRSGFDAPVYLLPNVTDAQEGQPTFMTNAVSVSGSIGVVIGFFLLQVGIVKWLHDWVQTALLAGSVIFEIALIWIWDSLTT
jgi:hypothetical protein